jgi:hypothetical protein
MDTLHKLMQSNFDLAEITTFTKVKFSKLPATRRTPLSMDQVAVSAMMSAMMNLRRMLLFGFVQTAAWDR